LGVHPFLHLVLAASGQVASAVLAASGQVASVVLAALTASVALVALTA